MWIGFEWSDHCLREGKKRKNKNCELNVNCMNDWMNSNLALYWIMTIEVGMKRNESYGWISEKN